MTASRTETRRKAWETRRERYGESGHGSAYARWSHSPVGQRAIALVIRLHNEGTLSEGQCCQALSLERVEFRKLVDDGAHDASALRQSNVSPGRDT